MAASSFPQGAICSGGALIDNQWCAMITGLIAVALLAIALVTALFDSHLQSRAACQAAHLRELNAALKSQAAATQTALRELHHFHYALDQQASVAETDLQGVITYANDKFCELSGYSRDEPIGSTHRILKKGVHPDEFYRELWARILSGYWRREVYNRSKAGQFYRVDASIVPDRDEIGEISQFVSIRTEITHSKLAQDALKAQETRLSAMSRRGGIGGWELDAGAEAPTWSGHGLSDS